MGPAKLIDYVMTTFTRFNIKLELDNESDQEILKLTC
jgi:hypothetical protein